MAVPEIADGNAVARETDIRAGVIWIILQADSRAHDEGAEQGQPGQNSGTAFHSPLPPPVAPSGYKLYLGIPASYLGAGIQ
jgi:hypothetical protein